LKVVIRGLYPRIPWEVVEDHLEFAEHALGTAKSGDSTLASSRLQSRVSSCGVCGGQSSNGTDFIRKSFYFPLLLNNQPLLHTRLTLFGIPDQTTHCHVARNLRTFFVSSSTFGWSGKRIITDSRRCIWGLCSSDLAQRRSVICVRLFEASLVPHFPGSSVQ